MKHNNHILIASLGPILAAVAIGGYASATDHRRPATGKTATKDGRMVLANSDGQSKQTSSRRRRTNATARKTRPQVPAYLSRGQKVATDRSTHGRSLRQTQPAPIVSSPRLETQKRQRVQPATAVKLETPPAKENSDGKQNTTGGQPVNQLRGSIDRGTIREEQKRDEPKTLREPETSSDTFKDRAPEPKELAVPPRPIDQPDMLADEQTELAHPPSATPKALPTTPLSGAEPLEPQAASSRESTPTSIDAPAEAESRDEGELSKAECVLRLFRTFGMQHGLEDTCLSNLAAADETPVANDETQKPTNGNVPGRQVAAVPTNRGSEWRPAASMGTEGPPPLPVEATQEAKDKKREDIAQQNGLRSATTRTLTLREKEGPTAPPLAQPPANETSPSLATKGPQPSESADEEAREVEFPTAEKLDRPAVSKLATKADRNDAFRPADARAISAPNKPSPSTPAPSQLTETAPTHVITDRPDDVDERVLTRRVVTDEQSDSPAITHRVFDESSAAPETEPARNPGNVELAKPVETPQETIAARSGRAVRKQLRKAIDQLVEAPSGIDVSKLDIGVPPMIVTKAPEQTPKAKIVRPRRRALVAKQPEPTAVPPQASEKPESLAQNPEPMQGRPQLQTKRPEPSTKPSPPTIAERPSPQLPPAVAENKTNDSPRPTTAPVRKLPSFRVLDESEPLVADRRAIAGGNQPGLLSGPVSSVPVPTRRQLVVESGPVRPAAPVAPAVTESSVPAQAKEVRLGVRTSYPMQAPGRVMRVNVANRDVCDVVQHSPYGLALVGKREGQTDVAIWLEGEREAKVYRIVVGRGGISPDQGKLQRLVADLFPESSVSIVQRHGAVHVEGAAKSRQEAIQILSVVRSVKLVPVVDNLQVIRR